MQHESKRQICFDTADHAHFASALQQNVLERGYGPKLGGRSYLPRPHPICLYPFKPHLEFYFQRLWTCYGGKVEAFSWTSMPGNHFFIYGIHARNEILCVMAFEKTLHLYPLIQDMTYKLPVWLWTHARK